MSNPPPPPPSSQQGQVGQGQTPSLSISPPIIRVQDEDEDMVLIANPGGFTILGADGDGDLPPGQPTQGTQAIIEVPL